MARGAPAASLRHREPGALLQVLHALGALDESHHVDGAQLAEFDGAIAESPNQELFGQRDVLDACRTRQSLRLTQILLERDDHTPNGRGLDGWGRSLLVDDARKTEIRHQPTQAQATPGGRRQLSWSRGRGASGGLAGASNHEIKLPRNRPQRPSHGSPYQADRGRLSYIQTECLRATPAPLRRRRFAVHDQTETAVHDRWNTHSRRLGHQDWPDYADSGVAGLCRLRVGRNMPVPPAPLLARRWPIYAGL